MRTTPSLQAILWFEAAPTHRHRNGYPILALWTSRMLEVCGHEALVTNARKLRLIYTESRKTDKLDPRSWLVWPGSNRGCSHP
jgi:hypothetical protein